MNVYDFDNTIYDGESTFDFFMYCVRKNPKQLKFLPTVLKTLYKYKRCIISKDELLKVASQKALAFISNIKNPQTIVSDFWDKKQHKIKHFYHAYKKNDDVIISASPSFLLDEIMHRLNINNCICSIIDERTGEIKQLCFSDNKTVLFKKKYPNAEIDNFFTDSMNDKPMIEISKNAFLIKDDKIIKIK